VPETRTLPAAKLSVSHERARGSRGRRRLAAPWSVWADAHDLEFEFEVKFEVKFAIKNLKAGLGCKPKKKGALFSTPLI